MHFFDVIVLIGLVHYFRRLRYPFLRFGIAAVCVGLLRQLGEHAELFSANGFMANVMGGLLYLGYGAMLAECVSIWLKRPAPRRVMVGAGTGFVLAAVYLVFDVASFDAARAAVVNVPGAFLMAVAAVMLIRYPMAGSIGSMWLVGLLLLNVGLALFIPFQGVDSPFIFHAHLLDDLVHLLTAVALLMMTSEQTLGDLVSKEAHIALIGKQQQQLELQFTHVQKLESLGMLAGGIAHDFNNMLTSILGYASLALQKLPNDSEVRKDIYMVMSGARQAADLTSQMLIYAGKGALEFEPVDVSKVVDSMSGLLHSIVPRKIQLVQRLARGLPKLKGDRVQLGQVAMNLTANAVEAIGDKPGVIEISTGLVHVDETFLRDSFFSQDREPGAYISLSLSDTGIGMNEAQIERIFDPFYTGKESGKGLGLSSISGIVRQHQGFVRVLSTPGVGSEFVMYFPVFADTENAASRRQDIPEGIRGRVLLADDDVRIRGLIVSILEGDHFQLAAAEDGREALDLYEGGKFDLLVLDCTMPKMSGAEIHRKVREGGSTVPIVLVSGYHQEQVAPDTTSDPNTWFVKKPFTVDDFLKQVHTAMRERQSA